MRLKIFSKTIAKIATKLYYFQVKHFELYYRNIEGGGREVLILRSEGVCGRSLQTHVHVKGSFSQKMYPVLGYFCEM